MRIYTLNTHLWKLNSNCKKTLFNETVEGSPINLSRISEIQNCFSKSGLYFQSYLALDLYSKVQFFINSSLKLIAWDQFERSLKTYSVASCGFFSLASLFLLFWFYDTQSNLLLLWKRLSLTQMPAKRVERFWRLQWH